MQALNTLIKKKNTRATNGGRRPPALPPPSIGPIDDGKVKVWTVMFNAMCPAELAAEGSYAFWEGQLCSGTEVWMLFLFDWNKFKGGVRVWWVLSAMVYV